MRKIGQEWTVIDLLKLCYIYFVDVSIHLNFFFIALYQIDFQFLVKRSNFLKAFSVD